MLFIGPHVFLGNHERINIHPSGRSCYHVCFDTQIFDFRYSHAKNCFCGLQLSFIDLNSSADLSPCANFAGWPVGSCCEGLDVKCTAERKGSCQCSYIVISTQSRTSQDWGAVYMVLEWLSFWNEFRFRVKFMLFSHDKIKQLKPRHYCVCGFLRQIRYTYTTHSRLYDLQFSFRKKVHFHFIRYQNLIFYKSKNFIQSENQNELIPEWLVPEENVVSVSCKQKEK